MTSLPEQSNSEEYSVSRALETWGKVTGRLPATSYQPIGGVTIELKDDDARYETLPLIHLMPGDALRLAEALRDVVASMNEEADRRWPSPVGRRS